jgi:integrase
MQKRRRRREQKGSIVRIGDRWFVRFWRDVNVTVEVKNERGEVERTEHRLVRKRETFPIGPAEGQATKNPPAKIRELAEEHVRKMTSSKIIPQRGTLTVREFVDQVYFPKLDTERRPGTGFGSRRLWARHLEQQVIQIESKRLRCANLMIADAEAYHIQGWLTAIADTAPRVLSKSTLCQCKFLLSGAFRLALQQGYRATASGNPVTPCSIPVRTTKPQPMHAYSGDEVLTMLRVLPEPARTVCLFAAETGLRVAELQSIRWEDFSADLNTLTVQRSVWRGHVLEPKTAASKAPVPIPRQLRMSLEIMRERDGSPADGPVFRTGKKPATPLSLNNVLDRQILPVLNRCATCGKAPGKPHRREKHEYQRDETMPRWIGWHGFRRGLATDLQAAGAAITTASGALRHADAGVTMRHYAKTVSEEVRNSLQERADRLEVGLLDSLRTVKRASGSQPETVQ